MRKTQDLPYALAVVLILLGAFFIVEESSEFGKNPNETVVVFKKERNLVTGEMMNVEIVRCKADGQVISYIEFNYLGKAVGGFVHAQDCGRKKGQPAKEPAESGFGPSHFDFWKWLDSLQKKLTLKD